MNYRYLIPTLLLLALSAAPLFAQPLPAASDTLAGLPYEIAADKPLNQNYGTVTLKWHEPTDSGKIIRTAVVRTGKTKTVGEVLAGLSKTFDQARRTKDAKVLYEIGHVDHGGLLRIASEAGSGGVQFFYMTEGKEPTTVYFSEDAVVAFDKLLPLAASN